MMIDEKQLNSFIIKRFIWTLLIIGVIQVFSNLLFANVINPFFEKLLGVELFRGAGFRDGILLIMEIFFARIISPNVGMRFIGFFEQLLGIDINQSGVNSVFLQLDELTAWQLTIYHVVVFCCCFVMIAIWVLPYIVGGISFSVAVSKRVKMVERQRIQKDREAERQKNLLLSDVAHDIKTPITTIAGFSQALAEGTVEEGKEQEYLDAIRFKSMQTVDMVTLLFEYVKLDSAGFKLHRATEDICEVLRGCVAKCYTDFEEKDMELELDIPEESIMLSLDKLQMERAFHNLLANAYKHNPNGTKIWISLEKNKTEILCKISDNGAFIESETAKHLFDPFVQGDKSRTSGKGTGLGLSITRKIVEMHGGRVRLIQYRSPKPYTKTFEIKFV